MTNNSNTFYLLFKHLLLPGKQVSKGNIKDSLLVRGVGASAMQDFAFYLSYSSLNGRTRMKSRSWTVSSASQALSLYEDELAHKVRSATLWSTSSRNLKTGTRGKRLPVSSGLFARKPASPTQPSLPSCLKKFNISPLPYSSKYLV